MRIRRIRIWVFLSIFLAVLLCHINVNAAQTEDKPVVKVDYIAKLNELSRAERDENLNAAPYYKKAFELCIEQPEQLNEDIDAWPKDLPEEKQIQLQDWVSANSNALEQLKLGAEKPYYWAEYQGRSMMVVVMPELKQARILTRAICLRAKLSATRGDFKEAFSDLLVCYQFGEHFAGIKTLIEQLVGIGIRKYTVEVSFQILDKEKPDLDLLKYLQQELCAILLKEPSCIDFAGEKLFLYDTIQRIFTDDGKGGGYVYGLKPGEDAEYLKKPLGLTELTSELKQKLEKLERRQTAVMADKLYGYLNEIADKTPWQFHNEGKALDKAIEEIIGENPLMRIIAPHMSRVLELAHRGKAEGGALIATLGILQYKAEKGQFPASLTELVSAGYLKELPIDPYSGKPLVYKRTKDNFLLYSFGADFDDDGGIGNSWGEDEEGGDHVFWPVE